ncbi:MAG: transporter permease, partial [Methylobacterium sp.]|nr:transporter permease [Methylobacterium sp.]
MVAETAPSPMAVATPGAPAGLRVRAWVARRAEALAIPLGALALGLGLFSLFLLSLGKSPAAFLDLVYRGGFGSAFALQNSLQRAAPLLFAA